MSAWLYLVEGLSGGRQPVLLLDTDLNENLPLDRELKHYLYGGDTSYRLKQEIVLGIGGVRLLQALGFTIFHYHMNEGHSALLGVELLRRYAHPLEELRKGEPQYDIPRVREMCSFTTHTPVEAGHDRFDYGLLYRVFDSALDIATIKQLAGEDSLNMTRLALNLSEFVNGVAKSHADVSNKMFPGYKVHAITPMACILSLGMPHHVRFAIVQIQMAQQRCPYPFGKVIEIDWITFHIAKYKF